MPHKEPDDSRVVSVRLPIPLVQRLDRLLDWQTTHRRRPTTRNAAMRDALRDWLDQQEQLAGLLDPQVLRQQFQAAYDSLRPSPDGSPSIGSAACCSGLGSGSMPCWKPCGPRRPLTSRPSRSRPATLKPPTTATMSMANAMAASAGVREQGLAPPAPAWGAPPALARGARLSAATSLQ